MLPFSRLAAVAAATCATICHQAGAQCALTPTDHWGGTVRDAVVIGDTMLAHIGPKLIAYDISNQANPRRMSELRYDGFDMAAGGGYLFLTQGNLRVIDVSNPAAIVEIGRWVPGDGRDEGPVSRPTYWSNHVYCWSQAGTVIFDVSDPTQPVPVGRFAAAQPGIIRAIDDGIAYAINLERLIIWDVSSPRAPRLLGTYVHSSRIDGFGVYQERVYIRGNDDAPTAAIVDTRDPVAPILVGYVPEDERGGSESTLGIQNGLLLTKGSRFESPRDSVRVFSLHEPSAPEFLARLDFESSYEVYPGAGAGDVALLRGFESSIALLNLSLPNVPRIASVLADSGRPNIEVGASLGNFALTSSFQSMRILEFVPGDRAGLIGEYRSPDFCIANLCMTDSILHISADGDRVAVNSLHRRVLLDVSNPRQPTLINNAMPRGLTLLAGDLLYVSNSNRLTIYSLAEPQQPQPLGEVELSGSASRLLSSGSLLFAVIPDAETLEIVDVSDPASPSVLSAVGVSRYTREFAAADGMLLVVGGPGGISGYDISDPFTPQPRPISGLPNHLNTIETRGGIWFASTSDQEIVIMDFQVPFQARIRSQFRGSDEAQNVIVGRGFLASLDWREGLTFYPIQRDGDLDSDGDVDLHDLVALLANFGAHASSGEADGDFDCNRFVDINDLSLLLASFGSER